MFFQIHEDKENFKSTNNIIENRKAIYNVQNKLSLPLPAENRKVLGHVTNTRHDTKIPHRYPLVQKRVSEIVVEHNVEQTKHIEDEQLLQKACLLLPCEISAVSSPLTPQYSSEDESVSDMSLGICSSLKKKYQNEDVKIKNEIFYTEPIYRMHIYNYLREAEHRHRPHPQYMTKQSELNDNMRCILVDWLVSISDEYDLAPDTLYLAVSLIDRFLSKMSVVRTKFQLLGVTAMMIAAKYEEIHPPDIREFSSLTKDTCSVRQILKMEQLVLRVLSFDLTTPTIQTFIEEYAIQANISKDCVNIAMLISELCLVESVHYISYLPSEIAASSIALSRHTLKDDIWPQQYEEMSGYSLDRLYPIVKMQHKVYEESPNKALQAVKIKYTKSEFRKVSKYTPRKLI